MAIKRFRIVLIGIAGMLLCTRTLAAKDHTAEYKNAKLGEKSTLSTGDSCTTAENIWGDLHTYCGATAVKTYEVVSDNGLVYLVQPDTFDPLAAMVTGDVVQFRIDGTNTDRLWTPDPKNGVCPWPCTGKTRAQWKQGISDHEAKYYVLAVRKQAPSLSNEDVIAMIKAGLPDGIIIQKIVSTKGAFDTSVAALKNLKEMNVSDAIIEAMIAKEGK